jgi:ABC-type polysaccharide/polyol phosphate transport system ATPase subunit
VDPVAIEARGVSKAFIVPHERSLRLKEYFAQPFRERTYDRNEALKEMSLSIPQGEFFGIVGPNGSGKSTLLKILAGIYRPDSGSVHVHGAVSPFIELGVGFNFELSARDNIEINGTLVGLTRRQIAERFDGILAFAELERFVDQQLKNYSSGMLMRLAYSIAVQVPFDILLIDEVLAVGDAAFQEKCFETFRQLRSDGKTVVFVSHDLDAVKSFCDRAMLIEHGVCQGIGNPVEIVERYLHPSSAAGRGALASSSSRS